MVNKKYKVATTPIHNSKTRAKDYLAIPKTHSQLREANLELKKHLEKEFPTKIAADLSKKEIKKIVTSLNLGKGARKKARRHFYNSRVAVYGQNARSRTPARPKRIRKYKYAEYIESWVWTDRRNRFYRTHPHKCVICGSSKELNLHHMVYTAFDGTEPDTNLVPLCGEHHKNFHKTLKVKGNMKKETLEFIDDQRQLIEFSSLTL